MGPGGRRRPQLAGAGVQKRGEGGTRGGAAAGAGSAGWRVGGGDPLVPPDPACPGAGGGTAMKLKLKNVFLAYFLVSIAGLLYALVQLGERGGAGGRRARRRAPAAVDPALGMNPRADTLQPARPSDGPLRPPAHSPL